MTSASVGDDSQERDSALGISTKDLSKRYDSKGGAYLSVDKLNLAIGVGEVYALLGDNGAGKTTTINMLTTLIPPSSGSFSICGFDGIKDNEAVKKLFGVVSQDVSVYQELTVYENLKFLADLYRVDAKESRKRIEQLLERFSLGQKINSLVETLSGGMQRRLAIACAMVNAPRVLFMDEPTVGLDPGSRRQIWAAIKELKGLGVTVLLTTHYLEEAELLADRIGIIRSGRLLVEGTVAELTERVRGMRGVAVRLEEKHRLNSTKVVEAMERLSARLKQAGLLAEHDAVRADALRNTLHLTPSAGGMDDMFNLVYRWLGEEELSFSRVALGEPNLEDVFMVVMRES